MAKKLKLSTVATEQMRRVKQRLRLDRRDNLWTLRIALARSLQLSYQSQTNTPAFFDVFEERRKSKDFEIEVATLEQSDGLLFRALLQQLYNRKMTGEEYENCLLKHTEHGLEILDNQTEKFDGYEYLLTIAQHAIRDLKTEQLTIHKEETAMPTGYEGVLSLRIGVEKETGEPQVINFNKTDEHLNNYVGIIGRPGSGKTYFAKYFLSKLREASNYQTNFIIFDYAKGDIANDPEFIAQTKAEVIRTHQQPIPVNIFRVPSNSIQDKRFAAERIVEIFKNVEAKIGNVQQQNLYDAIVGVYEDLMYEDNPMPDFHFVRHKLEEINPKPDSLTSVLRPLTEHNLFADRETPVWDSLVNRTVVFDIHELPALKDLCVFLVLREMYRELMSLPDSAVDSKSRAREMRTVIVIDEAHHFLKNKNRVRILEDLIREIRSKGASVMLLSQSPDDYDQAEFNFLELLEFVYVLGCNPSKHKFLKQVFGISDKEAKRLMQEVTSLGQGEAIGKDLKSTRHLLLCR